MLNFILSISEKSIFELLKDILFQESLNPLLIIGIIRKKNEWIIIDGNRRIICLKILLMLSEKWNLIKSLKIVSFLNKNKEKIFNFQKNFKELNKNKLEVIEFANRIESQIWTERLHTNLGGHTSEPWNTFVRNLHIGDPVAVFLDKKMKEYNISVNTYINIVKFQLWKRIFSLLIFRIFFL